MYDLNNLATLSNVQLQFYIISINSGLEYLMELIFQVKQVMDSLVITSISSEVPGLISCFSPISAQRELQS